MNNIANYIRDILMSQLMVVFSWGARNFKSIGESEEGEGGLEFDVNGFKHQGGVRIVLNWFDTFDIYLLDNNGNVTEKVGDVYLDSLVSVVDNMVENVEDYSGRVKEEYGIA
jgi:hypothetical protein